jgi:hypothetical protein
MDFKAGEAIIEKIGDGFMKEQAMMLFEPLTSKALKRMMRLKPAAMGKMMEHFEAEHKNPALFKEIMAEFMEMWKIADANKDGCLDLTEFKVFAEKYNDAMTKRWGESTKGDEGEDEKWFEAYSTINGGVNGVSIECFREGREMI